MRPSDSEIARRILAIITSNIASAGLHIQHVMGSEKSPPFSYTIGMTNIVFKLAEGEHLVLYTDKDGGTSFEYAGPRTPSDSAFDKATGILNAIKDDVHVRTEPDIEFGM